MSCMKVSALERREMKGFGADSISKKFKNMIFWILTLSNENNEKNLERSSTLRVSRAEIWLTVYRSIYIRMQEDIDWY